MAGFAGHEVGVFPVDGFDGVADGADPFGVEDAPAIARRWSAARDCKPELFDGIVLLATEVGIEAGRLVARYAEVRFSAFDWWRAEGPPRGLRNVFGAGVIRSADGAALLGRMAPHTAPAGQLYFPCGTPDRDDVRNGAVDLDGSIEREILEETGLGPPDIRPIGRRFVVVAPKLAAVVRRYDSPLGADELEARIRSHLDAQVRPELDEIRFVRSADEVDGASPPYVRLAIERLMRDPD